MLKDITKSSESLIEMAADGAKADVFVRVKGDKAFLVAVEVAQVVGELPPGATYFGPYSAKQTDKMQEDLTKIARARNLLKLVSGASANSASDLEIEMVKLRDKNDRDGEKLKWGPKGLVLQPGDLIGSRVTNRGRTTLDVTLLFVDSGYGIVSAFPRPGSAVSGENRFLPKQSHLVGPVRVNAKTVGLEHMMVIAVKGEGQPVDFTCLAQPTLERAAWTRKTSARITVGPTFAERHVRPRHVSRLGCGGSRYPGASRVVVVGAAAAEDGDEVIAQVPSDPQEFQNNCVDNRVPQIDDPGACP